MKRIEFTEDQIENIKKLYRNKNSFTEMSKLYNCDRKTIVKLLKEEGIYEKKCNQQRLNLSNNEKSNIVELYTEMNKSTYEIAELYNCNNSTILYILNNKGIETKRKRDNHNFKKYNVNQNYFNLIDDEIKAYWFGFILADGHVTKSKDHLMITLNKNDRTHLEKFRLDIESNHPIKQRNDYDSFEINIGSSILCNELYNKGINNRKSWEIDIDKIINSIPMRLYNHFIRGIFDGDGCIKIYKQTHYNKPLYHFSIVGLYDLLNFIKEQFDIDMSLKYDTRTKSTYELKTRSKGSIVKIREYLYKNATIYLDRKYEDFYKI